MILAADRQKIIDSIDPANAIFVYANLPEVFKTDREIAKRAMACDGLALAHAPQSIRADAEIVEIAIRSTCYAEALSLVGKISSVA